MHQDQRGRWFGRHYRLGPCLRGPQFLHGCDLTCSGSRTILAAAALDSASDARALRRRPDPKARLHACLTPPRRVPRRVRSVRRFAAEPRTSDEPVDAREPCPGRAPIRLPALPPVPHAVPACLYIHQPCKCRSRSFSASPRRPSSRVPSRKPLLCRSRPDRNATCADTAR